MDGPPVVGVRGILFTDVVGSTELLSRLGDDRTDALRRRLLATALVALARPADQVAPLVATGLTLATEHGLAGERRHLEGLQ